MSTIDSYPSEPEFTIKAVQHRTGIKPVTLRAWERRYNLLEPIRLPNGYRLYSERDIQLLLWVQRRVDSGISISQVVQQFNQIREKGVWPESIQTFSPAKPRKQAPRPARHYAELMFGALVAHNEERAGLIFEECQLYFDLLTIFQEVVQPCLALLDEAWFVGDIRLTTRHMAHTVIKGRMAGIMQGLPIIKEGALILVGCGPEETEEMDAMMLSVLLRQNNYHVEYLGQDLPTDDLIDYSKISRPKLICLAINTEPTAYLLNGFAKQLSSIRGKPKFAYFGKYVSANEDAREKLNGAYLGETLKINLERIRRLLTMGVV
ncbi:MAG: MerR family transcriptional regulator [Anaerolineaceae bacterium]|jgi:DNA-binding transcriptional MerR regulator|nr:MerR family transcriptional regulator [Anaerolineaceae bacterium]MDD4042656.1 MerR family transcriptional regulator [Anaerolineaceae bacterium]MDD4577896.1 MerR family transcriptional regulator [Anaerolineaceae bacterium]